MNFSRLECRSWLRSEKQSLSNHTLRVCLMALYTDPNALDNEQFTNFSFPHTANDLNQSLPIVDNIISQPAPRSDHAAASEFTTSMTTMADAITKFQADLSVLHALLSTPYLD